MGNVIKFPKRLTQEQIDELPNCDCEECTDKAMDALEVMVDVLRDIKRTCPLANKVN